MIKEELRFAERLYNRLCDLQECHAHLKSINEDISKYCEEKNLLFSSYERERAVQHIDDAKEKIWNLIGQLVGYSPWFIDEKFFAREQAEPES